jgi:hypothetical protein
MEAYIPKLGEKILFEDYRNVLVKYVPGVVLRYTAGQREYVIQDERGDLCLVFGVVIRPLAHEIIGLDYTYPASEQLANSRFVCLIAEPYKDEHLVVEKDGRYHLVKV